jgi:hypothetical protein
MRWLVLCLVAAALALPAPAGAERRRKRKRHANMPAGWTWPPSKAMKRAGADCLARLDELGIDWTRAPRTRKVATPIYLPTMRLAGVALEPIWRKPPFVLDCQLARAIAEVAPALRAAGVRALRFSTIHDYRHVRKNNKVLAGRLSRHAVGLAVDVYEVTDDLGQPHVVERDYPGGDQLLRAIELIVRPSGEFRSLLTPGNDPHSHDDHFHFEAAAPLPD